MAHPNKICPQCKVAMQIGYVASNVIPTEISQSWREGVSGQGGFFKTLFRKDTQAFKIGTYRCPSCSLLASYGEA
jgi:hypothetical protein